MKKNSGMFTALAGSAKAEDIALRISDMIFLMPESEALFLTRFTAITKAKNLEFDRSEQTARLNLKETREAAAGKRNISLHLRRFLTSPALRGLLDEQFTGYESALLAKNAGAVANAAASVVGEIANTPARAVFKPRKP